MQDFWETLEESWNQWYVGWTKVIVDIMLIVLIILFLWIIWGFILRRIKDNISPAQHNALRTLGRATILLLGIFWIAGPELFIGASALLGTAIGFASSTTLGNFLSGLYILVTNPFSVGNYIMLPDLKIEGIVEEISINYTKILTPQGIHASVTNQKLLGTTIHNTSIIIPQEAIDKGKIKMKDHESDEFDSLDDVVDVLHGFRTKFVDKTKEFHLYPLIFSVNPDKYLLSLTKEVLDGAVQKFSSQTSQEITWFISSRGNYQLNLIVENPYAIFDLKSDIIGYLEENMELVHEQK